MKHFLETKTNKIYAFEEDGSQDSLITKTMKLLTDEELEELRKPTKEQIALKILSQISDLEQQQLRPLRELIIDSTNQFAKNKLESIDAQISELRKQL